VSDGETGEPGQSAAFDDRLDRLRSRMSEGSLDGLVTSHPPNVRYLSGFTGSSGVLAVLPDRAVLVTDFRYEEQAGAELSPPFELEIARDGSFGLLGKLLGTEAADLRLGFEAEHLSVRDHERLREEAPGPEWTATYDLVEVLRARKDSAELALLERAADVACRALARTLEAVEAGVTELEMTAELEHRLRSEGSEGPAFETIVAAGPRSALPHARPSIRPLAEGDLLLMDFGAVTGGYRSDITRTFVLGPAAPWQEEIHAAVLAAREAALEAARPGVEARDVDAAARDSLEAAGFGERFGHATGHGIGLEVHEGPGLSRRSDAILQEAHVVTIEPGVYLPGRGGVRVEDDVVMHAGGARLLTDFPTDLREL